MPKAEIIPDNNSCACHNVSDRISELRCGQTMRPYLVNYPGGGVVVADFAFKHIDGGLCFVSIGWADLWNTHCPFHILDGPIWYSDRVWHAGEGATIRQLQPNDPDWYYWEEWNAYKASTDFPKYLSDGDPDQHAIECCRRDGAIGEPL